MSFEIISIQMISILILGGRGGSKVQNLEPK
nr:MAG TPA: hypothetical protein [Caudoviricetes sp.]